MCFYQWELNHHLQLTLRFGGKYDSRTNVKERTEPAIAYSRC